MIKVLSIDGGGIRGIIAARVLAEIERRLGRKSADVFDVIAGTSTGGILACGLAHPRGYPASEIVKLYQENGAKIFSRSIFQTIGSLFNLAGPKYSPDNLRSVLANYFGDAKLGQARTKLIIPAYDTQAPAPAFFKSWAPDPFDVSMLDATLATAAAPTFFPPHFIPKPPGPGMSCIDGGVFANNPAMCLLADLPKLFGEPSAPESSTPLPLLVLSIGTGEKQSKITFNESKGWGMAAWVQPLIHVLLDASADTVHYQLSELYGDNHEYYRVQGPLGGASDAMDDASPNNMKALLSAADRIIATTPLDGICGALAGSKLSAV